MDYLSVDQSINEHQCVAWLEELFHPNGLHCPRCGSEHRRLFRQLRHFPAYRCRMCDCYYTMLSGTAFAKSHQPASKIVWLIQGIANGESSVQLGREIGVGRKRIGELRQRLQKRLAEVALPDGLVSAFPVMGENNQKEEREQAAA